MTMDPMEDEVDELALDNMGTSSTPPKEPRLRAFTRPSSRLKDISNSPFTSPATPIKVGNKDKNKTKNNTKDKSKPLTSLEAAECVMSSSRYPKRRRINGREKEPTPPPPPPLPVVSASDEKPAYDSSPDELAPSSSHPTRRPTRTTSRTTSQSTRGRKSSKRSLPDIQKTAVPSVVSEPEPIEMSITVAAPEASDDELNDTTAAPAESQSDREREIRTASVKHEEDFLNGLGPQVPVHDAPIQEVTQDKESNLQLSEDAFDSELVAEPSSSSPPTEPSASAAQLMEDSAREHGSVEHSVEKSHLEVPGPRRRSTFRGSFLKVEPRLSPNRYVSKSPPPYSRVSTPLATPRELPPAPPQYTPYRERMVLKGHKKGVAAVKFSPDGRLIASCC